MPVPMPQRQTSMREAILEAAEDLFSRNGFRAVSMREIAQASGANLGSISYHFGSKDGLLRAIYERHSGPMNRRRGELLSEAQRIRDPDDRLAAIVRAFILPSLSESEGGVGGGARFARLRAVVMAERHEEAQKIIAETFNPINLAFLDALQACLPRLSRADIVWRTHFLLGAVSYTLINPWRVARLSDGVADGEDTEEALTQIVRAAVAAFRAPAGTDAAS
ncbi:TetR/AcrR family transcriptional regulator [Azospirillum agricola]|uniref:TetR/AcrR family transcriptional regulator n=1 Tax=Azospirillum agricola TaxID=1720247 RepID=UPI000A0F1F7A|nr:TetR family transcriptional regulator [Azospirillum agricola]SMH62513.1 transcriptional regulator, TetR family [Azospirillum lipoferum]